MNVAAARFARREPECMAGLAGNPSTIGTRERAVVAGIGEYLAFAALVTQARMNSWQFGHIARQPAPNHVL